MSDLQPKTFKRRMRDGERLYGFFVGTPAPATVEMVGFAGYDFVVIDQEHGPASTETLEHLCRAADVAGIAAIIRVPSGTTADILHALDAGATGILVPHVADAATARRLLEAAHYPPLGTRGISTLSRAGRYGLTDASDYLARRKDVTVVMALVEDREALEHVSDIVSVEGLDAVFVGTSDLAASMGHVGNPKHPDVAKAVAELCEKAVGASALSLATAVRSLQDVEQFHQQGVRLFCFNTTSLLATALSKLRSDLRK